MSILNMCPNCKSKKVTVSPDLGLTLMVLGLGCMTFGLSLFLFMFVPKYGKCKECGAKWKV